MNMRKKLVLGITGVILALVIALALSFSLGLIGIPRVTGMESQWRVVSENHTQIWTTVTVDNPNFFTVPLSSLHYRVLLNNITMAEGEDQDVSLQAGDTILEYVSDFHLHKIPAWWSTHLENNETTTIEIAYEATAALGPLKHTSTTRYLYKTVHTDLMGALAWDEPKAIVVATPHHPSFHLVTATHFDPQWGVITENTTTITTTVSLYNPHPQAVSVSDFRYQFFMNGIRVGEGYLQEEKTLLPHAVTPLQCDTLISHDRLIDWFTSHLQNNESSTYQITSTATITYQGATYTVHPVDITSTLHTHWLD